MEHETDFHEQGAVLLAQSGGCSVWQFRNQTGEGTMTTYELFPGVALSFNDFHMASFESRRTRSFWPSTTAARAGWNTRRQKMPSPTSRPGT